MEKIIGRLAMLSSLYTVLVGLGAQALSNYQRHSVSGLSLHFFISMYVLYFLWLAYGLVKPKKDYNIIIPNIIGMLVGLVLIFQFIAYR